jgi:hypothetical protein
LWAKDHRADSLASRKIKPVSIGEYDMNIAAWKAGKQAMRRNLQWLLGEEPSGVRPENIGFVRDGQAQDSQTENITFFARFALRPPECLT